MSIVTYPQAFRPALISRRADPSPARLALARAIREEARTWRDPARTAARFPAAVKVQEMARAVLAAELPRAIRELADAPTPDRVAGFFAAASAAVDDWPQHREAIERGHAMTPRLGDDYARADLQWRRFRVRLEMDPLASPPP